MDVHTAAETGTRARTRRAILDAAVTVLTADPAAALADIAAAAGVGRTTVHRYFPERAELLTALSKHVWDQVVEATHRARLDEGTAAQALGRLCQEYFDLGTVLTLVFNDPAQAETWDECSPTDLAVLDLIGRGHRDGTIDPAFSAAWVRDLLWALLYSAWQQSTTGQVSRHDALDACLRALRKVIAP
ncbi:TetR/AcrR family transcriptional regulator [Actinokineospora diospyrosa]|uniref:Transcriptional regulator, TetR family n=1 Tax=Actinokineospora diospyrosa TaxID=103728 RepID=A0ABT1IFG6_9PSEU|nr:TetR/AcrR family transcriptional regulator [Actinokineospora diospyrosa]MCP2271021.1 transcriptional regulator, TetR family [Actinokineospora diospyrosa]